MQHPFKPLQAPAIPDGASDSGGVPLWAGFGPSAARGATGLSQQMGAGNPPPPDDDGSESGGGVLDGFFAQVASIKVGSWAFQLASELDGMGRCGNSSLMQCWQVAMLHAASALEPMAAAGLRSQACMQLL